MFPARIFRLIHTNSLLWQATNKSLLAKLRKKTGYTFANCRKALELHENDVEKVRSILYSYFIHLILVNLQIS